MKPSIKNKLISELLPNQSFSLTDAYELCKDITDKPHSIRARIYEGVHTGLFKKVAKGVYTLVDNDNNSVLLVEGDGRDLSMLEDNSIDCIITDHPYHDPKSNKGGNRSFADYDAFLYTISDFQEKMRVLKDGAFLVEFFAEENANNFDYIYDCKKMAQSVGLEYYATVNWKKGSFVANTGRKAKNTEQLVFFTKGSPRALKLDAKKNISLAKQLNLDTTGLSSHDIAFILSELDQPVHYMKGTAKMLPTEFDVENIAKNKRIHQAEKPVALFEKLLDYITLKNETILDQFSGSGNLGIACLNKQRNAILIEKDITNYSRSKRKISNLCVERRLQLWTQISIIKWNLKHYL